MKSPVAGQKSSAAGYKKQQSDGRKKSYEAGYKSSSVGSKKLPAFKNKKEHINMRKLTNDKDIEDKPKHEKSIDDRLILAGRNPIIEAIGAGKDIEKILIKEGELIGSIRSIIPLARENNIKIERITRKRLDELAPGVNHQGILAFLPAVEYVTVTDIVKKAEEKGEPPFIIVLNHVEDPYNLGAIIRTAYAAGAHGVIIPNSRAAGLGPATSKASAGAINHMPIARVSNIANTIEYLKKHNIWVACANMKGTAYFKEDLRGAIALVIGGENQGTTDNIRKKCDFTISIPMYGDINSLNASVAAGLLMYEVVRRRHFF